MKVLVCCALSVLVCQTLARTLDYPLSRYEDFLQINPNSRLSLYGAGGQDNYLTQYGGSGRSHTKRSRYYSGYKRSSLNELIQRLMALRGDSRDAGRASLMRFGAGRRR